MEKGLIVSVQGYSVNTTKELSDKAIKGGAIGIRTDQPITVNMPIIGLKKNKGKYHITTNLPHINEVSKWANYVAIDSRKGNNDIRHLLSYCNEIDCNFISDISSDEDVKNILNICSNSKLKLPSYFATTFCHDLNYNKKLAIIKNIKEITNVKNNCRRRI